MNKKGFLNPKLLMLIIIAGIVAVIYFGFFNTASLTNCQYQWHVQSYNPSNQEITLTASRTFTGNTQGSVCFGPTSPLEGINSQSVCSQVFGNSAHWDPGSSACYLDSGSWVIGKDVSSQGSCYIQNQERTPFPAYETKQWNPGFDGVSLSLPGFYRVSSESCQTTVSVKPQSSSSGSEPTDGSSTSPAATGSQSPWYESIPVLGPIIKWFVGLFK